MEGQINLKTPLGQFIYNFVYRNEVIQNIVDIGTWNGMGTTLCILKALEDRKAFDTNLYSLELYENMYKIALANLKEYITKFKNFKLLHGKIVNLEDIFEWFDHSSINFVRDQHAAIWYNKDLYSIYKAPNVLNMLPSQIDLLILDGGEYSTYPEWLKLKDRTRFFILDDTKLLKCKKIREEVISNPEYTVLFDIQHDRNGYLIGYKNQ